MKNLKPDLVKLCWSRGKGLERHTQIIIINLVILIVIRFWSSQALIALNLRLTQTQTIRFQAIRVQLLQLRLKSLGSVGFVCQSGSWKGGGLGRNKRQIVFKKWCYWENTKENKYGKIIKGTWYSFTNASSSSDLIRNPSGCFDIDSIPFNKVAEDHTALRRRPFSVIPVYS